MRKTLFHGSPSFWWPRAFLDLWLPNSNFCLHLHMAIFSCVDLHHLPSMHAYLCVQISFTSGHLSYCISAQFNDLILTQLPLQRPYFQLRSYSEGLEVRTSTNLFWETLFNPQYIVCKTLSKTEQENGVVILQQCGSRKNAKVIQKIPILLF